MAEVSGTLRKGVQKISALTALWTPHHHHVAAADVLSSSPRTDHDISAISSASWSLSAGELTYTYSAANFEYTGNSLGMACWKNKNYLQCLHIPNNQFKPLLLIKRNLSGKRATEDTSLPFYRSRTAYYDILKVSQKATQAQIKTAYYEQSFLYHPDRNQSDEAPRLFALVAEAYNVLGSAGLRKKYDRGLLNQADVEGAVKPSTTPKPKRPITYGKTAYFDFDAFYEAHYGEQLRRERMAQIKKEQLRQKEREFEGRWRQEATAGATVICVLVLAAVVISSTK